MTNVRDSFTNIRIHNLRILLAERLTPLLRKEIHEALALHSHSETSQNSNADIEAINPLLDKIIAHWTKIYGDLDTRAQLLENMTLFQDFLVRQLLQDYAEEPYQKITPWEQGQVDLVKQHYETEGSSDEDIAYQTCIILPLEELMLNRKHIEQRLLLAEQRSSGSYIKDLISNNDWLGLGAALRDDSDLVATLCEEKSLDDDWFNEGKKKRVLGGVKEATKYLSRVHQPTRVENISGRHDPTSTNDRASTVRLVLTPPNTNQNLEPVVSGSSSSWSLGLPSILFRKRKSEV